MASIFKRRWVDYTVFGLSVFLIFCLVFESYIALPPVVAWVGRWHPLILHFPIVLLLIAVYFGLSGRLVPRKLLTIAVLSVLITAICGFFLSKETGSKGNILFWHQWLGAGLALLSALWYRLEGMGSGHSRITKALQIVLIGLIVFTGHYGGMVTHGEDFLALPTTRAMEKIPENPLIYQHVVHRILENKCTGCHNPNKHKGQLNMNTYSQLLMGGEVGNTILPGNPEKSELVRRLHLPNDDEEHMPPEGKKPLEDNEILVLERWIALGASDTLRLDHLDGSEPLVSLVEAMMDPKIEDQWANLPRVADSTLQNLASDYLTISRIANNSNALEISAFLPPVYNAEKILALNRIAANIVELDLSGLPIGKKEMGLVAQCSNLDWLEIDRTPVTDSEIDTLKSLSHLRMLKVYHTDIGDASLTTFQNLKNLKRLYLWGTMISPKALADLKLKRPDLLIDEGIADDVNSFFATNDSLVDTLAK